MDSNTVAESDMSLKSRWFLHRVNDRVRKMLDHSSKDATQDSNKHSLIWRMFRLRHYKHLYSWERITQKIFIPSKIQEGISQWNRCLTYLKRWLPDNQMTSMEWIQLTGMILHGNIYLWWWRSHQSLARKGLRIFRFCVMPWKDEREPTIKFCLGRQVDVVQKLIIMQSFGHNWWWANGIRVEYFPRIHHIAALQRSLVKNERRARRTYRTDHLHVDVQRHLRMRIKRQPRL